MNVMIEISPGELLDKITILYIKNNKITDEAKLKNINRELNILLSRKNGMCCHLEDEMDQLNLISDELQTVNEEIWEYEDIVRDCERDQLFDDSFLVAARGIYKANDKRSRLKRQINDLLKSEIVEEKSYTEY